jgi:cytochrome P450
VRKYEAGVITADLVESFDLNDLPNRFYDNPYVFYQALRDLAPIKRLADGSYFLTRYADVLAVYNNPQIFSSDKKIEFKPKYGDSLLYEHHTTSLVFNDPPLHTRVRRLITAALTPRAIGAMEPALIALVDRLLDQMQKKNEVDLIEDFASAIPIEVIGNLLGVPREERRPLRGWSLAILSALEPTISQNVFENGNRAVREFLDYLAILIADRRTHPGDPQRDVLTALVQGESSGDRLTEAELLHNCIFILNAGHETTTNLIGNALVLLYEWPEQRRRLIAAPDSIKTAIEEFLRFESSNQLGNRITIEDTEIDNIKMSKGTRIHLCIGGANRDTAQFPDPDRLDLGRTPNRHLAFAWGIHACAGMSLARLEGRVAVSRFLQRFPNYKLIGVPKRSERARFRGFLAIEVDTE